MYNIEDILVPFDWVHYQYGVTWLKYFYTFCLFRTEHDVLRAAPRTLHYNHVTNINQDHIFIYIYSINHASAWVLAHCFQLKKDASGSLHAKWYPNLHGMLLLPVKDACHYIIFVVSTMWIVHCRYCKQSLQRNVKRTMTMSP